MNRYIEEKKIRRQAWKFYFVAIAWPIYVFLLPAAWDRLGPMCLLLTLFPGAYLYVWMAFLMHECWHKYVPNIANGAFSRLYSYMLLTDPQIFKMLHGHHHSLVHTWSDTEFHPLGRIDNAILRRIYNLLSVVLGMVFIVALHMHILPRHPKYKDKYKLKSHIISVAMWFVIYGGLAVLAHITFRVSIPQVLGVWLLNLWVCSLFLQHAELVEHANLIVDGDHKERNIASRNLRRKTLAEKFFHLLTHGDAREHVLHHTLVAVYSRPFPGKVPMPSGSVYISLRDYAGIVWNMIWRG